MENELKDKLILVPKISEIRHMGGGSFKKYTSVYCKKQKQKPYAWTSKVFAPK